jgi:hypothetical protein
MYYAVSCVVNFYNAGVVTRGRKIGSRMIVLFLCRCKWCYQFVKTDCNVGKLWSKYLSIKWMYVCRCCPTTTAMFLYLYLVNVWFKPTEVIPWKIFKLISMIKITLLPNLPFHLKLLYRAYLVYSGGQCYDFQKKGNGNLQFWFKILQFMAKK